MSAIVDDVNKTEIQSAVLHLKSLIKCNAKLSQYEFDDYFLTRFLYASKFHIVIALELIQQYEELRVSCPQWFTPLTMQELSDQKFGDRAVLKGRDRVGRRVFVMKIGQLDIQGCPLDKQCCLFQLLIDKLMLEKLTLENGVAIIIDVRNFPWKLIQWLTPNNIRMMAKLLECYPTKELIIHVVNKSHLVQIGVKIVWPFLSEQRKKMIHFHFNDWESLHEHVDPKNLPQEYGGTGPDINVDEIKEQFLEHGDYLIKRSKQNMYLVNKNH
ncbi:hypothetical protein FQA39_LY11137 [Lamprigera yunnana]|nr:hypothetical protein FQA39_LY11137 [Lamprigera yunnana]